ncbi:hypothetical protein CH272_04435 [Rhodococcus sp. 05-340-1]|uniref:hypothetical protein n=1 Tax=unclassified Rhodococcus (in: high G+C Gram-positive bacteria) TaxID=192944 RepID=UPI000B9C5CE7|nr:MULTISPECIES: hypothetical protein [unclassified Rhodococcus (in: high G+C Gram-positive bacteria)]OZD61252.1 hypothetical protein CH271_26330 [Rhodococcus sp. 05-340-2]OZD82471.1 hypothetical protein CH272_04435 [Rhodococcus sp. 05-340-1]
MTAMLAACNNLPVDELPALLLSELVDTPTTVGIVMFTKVIVGVPLGSTLFILGPGGLFENPAFEDPAVQEFLATDPRVKDILLPLQ